MQVGRLLFAALTSPYRHTREAPTDFFSKVGLWYMSTQSRTAGKKGGAGAVRQHSLSGGGPLSGGSPRDQGGPPAGGQGPPASIAWLLKDCKGVALHALAAAKVTNLSAYFCPEHLRSFSPKKNNNNKI